METTLPIVKEQLLAFHISELYDTVDAIYCFLAGDPTIMSQIKEFLQKGGKKIIIQAEGPNDTSQERFTLLKIHSLVKDGDKFMYLHSKGVTRGQNEAIYWWRLYIQRFCMKNIPNILSQLDTHDVAGPSYLADPYPPHFSGNFWWSTGKYYKSLPVEIGPEYMDPETYILTKQPKMYKIDHMNQHILDKVITDKLSFYENPITPSQYL